jgi:hypothetical protein
MESKVEDIPLKKQLILQNLIDKEQASHEKRLTWFDG